MSRKQEPPRCKRGGQGNFDKSQNRTASRKSQAQSPWAGFSPSTCDPLDDVILRSRADADRLQATSNNDAAWFDANQARRFHIREATPHEKWTGLAPGSVLVVRYSEGRLRLPVPYVGVDAPWKDIEEEGRMLFDLLTDHFTAANTDPYAFGVIQEIRAAMPRRPYHQGNERTVSGHY